MPLFIFYNVFLDFSRASMGEDGRPGFYLVASSLQDGVIHMCNNNNNNKKQLNTNGFPVNGIKKIIPDSGTEVKHKMS